MLELLCMFLLQKSYKESGTKTTKLAVQTIQIETDFHTKKAQLTFLRLIEQFYIYTVLFSSQILHKH